MIFFGMDVINLFFSSLLQRCLPTFLEQSFLRNCIASTIPSRLRFSLFDTKGISMKKSSCFFQLHAENRSIEWVRSMRAIAGLKVCLSLCQTPPNDSQVLLFPSRLKALNTINCQNTSCSSEQVHTHTHTHQAHTHKHTLSTHKIKMCFSHIPGPCFSRSAGGDMVEARHILKSFGSSFGFIPVKHPQGKL